jgi:hypothetical protein
MTGSMSYIAYPASPLAALIRDLTQQVVFGPGQVSNLDDHLRAHLVHLGELQR